MRVEISIEEDLVFIMNRKLLDPPDGRMVLLTRILVISVQVSAIGVMSVISSVDSIRVDDRNDLEYKFL